MARLLDVSFVLNEIEKRHSAKQDPWHLASPAQVGLAGHSFGAHTTMGMAGQRYPGFDGISEQRLASFIAFSPRESTFLRCELFLHKKVKINDHLHSAQAVCSTYLPPRTIVNAFAINASHLRP